MSGIRIAEAGAVPVDDLRAAVVAAFADYLAGPFQLPPAAWPPFLGRQGVDLALSRVALDGATVVAFALVAPRPADDRWRLATMGALPAARGSGIAARLLDDVLTRAEAAGRRGVELEVFAQNERAVRLYRRHGFEARHALNGHERPAVRAAAAAAPVPPPGIDAVPLTDACDWLVAAARHCPELPLQVLAPSLRHLPPHPPPQAWRTGSAQLVFVAPPPAAGGPPDAAPPAVTTLSLVDLDPAQRDAARLVDAWSAAWPDRRLFVPALQRDDVGGDALRRAGFATQPLHQWWMLRAPGIA